MKIKTIVKKLDGYLDFCRNHICKDMTLSSYQSFYGIFNGMSIKKYNLQFALYRELLNCT